MSALSMDLCPHTEMSDELLAQRIRSHIMKKHRIREPRLTVEVNDGVATLRGRASSYYQRQLWLHDVKSFKEVEEVIDLIEVA
jgi:osmotically-inducible protein OsmY